MVLYWLAYDSFHLTNFLWNLQLWRFLACKQPNPYHCWQKCVSMHIFGHHWKTTRICLLWHDLWLERRLQSHLQRWFLRHGLHADQQSKILPENKIVKLKKKINWRIIWNSKLSGKNRQIKAVLSCFTYDRSILTSNFHLFFVLTITWEEMLILGLVNKFVFLIIFFRLSRFRNLKTFWIFFCWNLMFIYNFLKKLRCFSGAKKKT